MPKEDSNCVFKKRIIYQSQLYESYGCSDHQDASEQKDTQCIPNYVTFENEKHNISTEDNTNLDHFYWKMYGIKDESVWQDDVIIISYYGGYNISFFDNEDLTDDDKLRRLFTFDSQYFNFANMYFEVLTDDINSSVLQFQQFQSILLTSIFDGQILLTQTIKGFITFLRAVKKKYPNKSIYYMGSSFGATKGGLINLILSNPGKENEIIDPKFSILRQGIKDLHLTENDKKLLNGFILHDGQYYTALNDGSKRHSIGQFFFDSKFLSAAVQKYKSDLPVLLLHNFDDERATIDQSLFFYNQLIKDGTPKEKVRFYVTPQAAPKTEQTHEYLDFTKVYFSSTDGHGDSYSHKYKYFYLKQIEQFIKDFMNEKRNEKDILKKSKLSELRYDHIQKLYSGSDAFEDTPSGVRSDLLRLYYANIHNKTREENETLDVRLNKVFIEYAAYRAKNKTYLFSEDDRRQSYFTETYLRLKQEHKQWLQKTIQTTAKERLKYVFSMDKELDSVNILKIHKILLLLARKQIDLDDVLQQLNQGQKEIKLSIHVDEEEKSEQIVVPLSSSLEETFIQPYLMKKNPINLQFFLMQIDDVNKRLDTFIFLYEKYKNDEVTSAQLVLPIKVSELIDPLLDLDKLNDLFKNMKASHFFLVDDFSKMTPEEKKITLIKIRQRRIDLFFLSDVDKNKIISTDDFFEMNIEQIGDPHTKEKLQNYISDIKTSYIYPIVVLYYNDLEEVKAEENVNRIKSFFSDLSSIKLICRKKLK